MGTFGVDANRKTASGLNHEGERTDAAPRDGAPRSSKEVRENGQSEGGACSEAKFVGPTRNGRSLKDDAKSYCISRREVLEAYRKVKSNKRAAGIDEQSIANLFLHYAFDLWMRRKWRHLPFEGYADDIIVHCRAK